MAAATRTVKVRFDGSARGLEHASRQAHGAVDGVGKAVRGLAVAATAAAAIGGAAIAGAAALGQRLVAQATSLELMGRKASVVFEKQLPVVKAWAKQNAKAFGLTSRELIGLAANFADLLKPMGFTAKQATAMSTKVIGLSGALAEWSNGQFTAADIADRLSAAMLGERESLKSVGIAISQADVDARLAAKGQSKLTGALREQAEATATMELIFEKSTDAQTAFAIGSGTLGRTISGLKAGFREWADDMAVRFTPNIKDAIAKLQAFAKAPEVQAFINNLRAAFTQIAEKALPLFREAFQHVVQAFKDNRPQIELVVKLLGVTLVAAVLGAIEGIRILITTLGFIVRTMTPIVRFWLSSFKTMLDAAVLAFGWIPALGPKLKEAKDKFGEFVKGVNNELDKLRDQQIDIKLNVKGQVPRAGKAVALQSGGWMSAGRSYLVGEQGPELVTPTQAGFVHNARDTAAMVGGPNVLNLTLNLGHGIQEVISINLRDHDRSLKRRAMAGAR